MSTERERANVIRDILALPERDQIEVIGVVSEDLAAGGAPPPGAEVAEQMGNAIELFDKVADHLGYDSDIAKLAMRIRDFDAAPVTVREGVRARQIAAVFHGSWPIAKQAAIREQIPISPIQRRGRQHFIKEQRRTQRAEKALYEWIATNPAKTTMRTYNAWREKKNEKLSDDEPKYPAATSLLRFWDQSWPELVADAKAGTLKPPVAKPGDPFAAERSPEAMGELGQPIEFEPGSPGELVYDPELIARRLREARTSRQIGINRLADTAGLGHYTVSRIEDGTQLKRIMFRTIALLARALEVPLDFFATPDEKTGLPPKRPVGEPMKRGKRRG